MIVSDIGGVRMKDTLGVLLAGGAGESGLAAKPLQQGELLHGQSAE